MIRVLVVDDHAVLRSGIKTLVDGEPDMEVVAEASSVGEAMEFLRRLEADVVLLDINLPDISGLDALNRLRQLQPTLPVLILSMHPEDIYGVRAIRQGARGYLSKNCDPSEILQAIRAIGAGARYIGPVLGEKLAAALDEGGDINAHETLSSREHEVMRLIVDGKGLSEIAAQLSLSVNTVSTYRARILKKLNLGSNAELARYAVENNLVA